MHNIEHVVVFVDEVNRMLGNLDRPDIDGSKGGEKANYIRSDAKPKDQ